MISFRNTFCSLLLALVSCAPLVAQSAPLVAQSNTVDESSFAQKVLTARGEQMDLAVFRRLQADASLNLSECTPMKHTVSTQVYCHFLNAVATTDEHHLYTDKMETDGYIERHGSPGSYYYLYGREASDLPMGDVDWFAAARFCNWMENGAPEIGVENESSTEAGVYPLNGLTSENNKALSPVNRSQGAVHFLASDYVVNLQCPDGMTMSEDVSVACNNFGFCITEMTPPVPKEEVVSNHSDSTTIADNSSNHGPPATTQASPASVAGGLSNDLSQALSQDLLSQDSVLLGAASPISMAAATIGGPISIEDNSGFFKMDFVKVGDPNNPNDYVTTGLGTVSYNYHIGKFDVTAEQYCAFLNAVASKEDTYGLFDENMATDPNVACISRYGPAGQYLYKVPQGKEKLPITFVNWFSAVRFCNWMANGQPVGAQDLRTTEDGSYTIMDGTSVMPAKETAVWRLPTDKEWYKAAFYVKGTSVSAPTYWTYTTGLVPPGNSAAEADNQPDSPQKNANYFLNGKYTRTNDANDTTGKFSFLTPVGTFKNSPGPWGTFDMGGNVAQWTDDWIKDSATGKFTGEVITRGGSWSSLAASKLNVWQSSAKVNMDTKNQMIGFRLVYIDPIKPSFTSVWGDISGTMKGDLDELTDIPHHPGIMYTQMNYHIGLVPGGTVEWAMNFGGRFLQVFYTILAAVAKAMFAWIWDFLPASIQELLASAGATATECVGPGTMAAQTAELIGQFAWTYGPIIAGGVVSAIFAYAMYEVQADPDMSTRMAIGAGVYSIASVCRIIGDVAYKSLVKAGLIVEKVAEPILTTAEVVGEV